MAFLHQPLLLHTHHNEYTHAHLPFITCTSPSWLFVRLWKPLPLGIQFFKLTSDAHNYDVHVGFSPSYHWAYFTLASHRVTSHSPSSLHTPVTVLTSQPPPINLLHISMTDPHLYHRPHFISPSQTLLTTPPICSIHAPRAHPPTECQQSEEPLNLNTSPSSMDTFIAIIIFYILQIGPWRWSTTLCSVPWTVSSSPHTRTTSSTSW